MIGASRRPVRAWRWATWYVAIGCALPHVQADAMAAQPAARVATGEELSAALRANVPHIVVTEHLDLTGLTPDFQWPEDIGGAALFLGSCRPNSIGALSNGPLSIRVRAHGMSNSGCGSMGRCRSGGMTACSLYKAPPPPLVPC